ncbi:hypothetical protein L7F22_029337 [Adiantum nelumboides]|nr:hypothetical protein [Adiantum nelumboides]
MSGNNPDAAPDCSDYLGSVEIQMTTDGRPTRLTLLLKVIDALGYCVSASELPISSPRRICEFCLLQDPNQRILACFCATLPFCWAGFLSSPNHAYFRSLPKLLSSFCSEESPCFNKMVENFECIY